jgi:hypothetical protein
MRTHLFAPYIGALLDAKREVSPYLHQVQIGKSIRDPVASRPWQKVLYMSRKTYNTAKSLFDKDCIFILDPKV